MGFAVRAGMRLYGVIFLALITGECGGSATAPSPNATPTPLPAPSPLPSPAPTPSPSPAPSPTFTLSGVVTDGLDGSPLSSVTVTTVGPLPSSATTVTDGRGRYSIPFSASIQSVRFLRPGFVIQSHLRPPGDATLNIVLSRECTVVPFSAPTVSVGADSVEFTWVVTAPGGRNPYPGVTDFLLEVGILRPSDASYFEQQVLSAFTHGAAFYKWQTPGVPPGTYWARFRTKNDCGLSVPSFITSFSLR